MPEITVTETQRETLAEIQSDLEAAYIDTYGQIRTTDVLQYLLDTYTPPEQQGGDVAYERIATAEFPRLQEVATDVEDVPGSGIDAETMRGELLSTLGVEAFATRLADLDGAKGSDGGGSDADSGGADGSDTSADDASPDAPSETEGATEDADSGSTGGPGAAGGSADSILSAANQLLDDHDDKWRKGGGNEPYEVDLPDGTTKTVRTKDDIRQILFKHY